MANETAKAAERNQRRTLVGVVSRDKMAKTRRVDVERLVKHPRYGKYIKRRTVCYAHDEKNESHLGDMVEIMETRPLSKSKNWRLLRVVTRAPAVAAPLPSEVGAEGGGEAAKT